jgi:hypothetical protein
MSGDKMAGMTEAEEAEWWYEHRDQADDAFPGPEVAVEVRRNVTISVRFSDEEIEKLRARADDAGVKVTALIRAAALRHAGDEVALLETVEQLRQLTDRVVGLVRG